MPLGFAPDGYPREVPQHKADRATNLALDPELVGYLVTRYKELRRLEKAVEDKNENELKWASAWCHQRLSMATMKHHQKHWLKLKKKVDAAIADLHE